MMKNPRPISLKLPVTLTHHSDGLKIESCHGEISDLFRKMYYEDIVGPPLQDKQSLSSDFTGWLNLYREAGTLSEDYLIKEAKCD
jgi:hypothetical protein